MAVSSNRVLVSRQGAIVPTTRSAGLQRDEAGSLGTCSTNDEVLTAENVCSDCGNGGCADADSFVTADIAVGTDISTALDADGRWYVWGNLEDSGIDQVQSTPYDLGLDCSSVDALGSMAVATCDGVLYAWGASASPQTTAFLPRCWPNCKKDTTTTKGTGLPPPVMLLGPECLGDDPIVQVVNQRDGSSQVLLLRTEAGKVWLLGNKLLTTFGFDPITASFTLITIAEGRCGATTIPDSGEINTGNCVVNGLSQIATPQDVAITHVANTLKGAVLVADNGDIYTYFSWDDGVISNCALEGPHVNIPNVDSISAVGDDGDGFGEKFVSGYLTADNKLYSFTIHAGADADSTVVWESALHDGKFCCNAECTTEHPPIRMTFLDVNAIDCVVLTTGVVYCKGRNNDGRLAIDDADRDPEESEGDTIMSYTCAHQENCAPIVFFRYASTNTRVPGNINLEIFSDEKRPSTEIAIECSNVILGNVVISTPVKKTSKQGYVLPEWDNVDEWYEYIASIEILGLLDPLATQVILSCGVSMTKQPFPSVTAQLVAIAPENTPLGPVIQTGTGGSGGTGGEGEPGDPTISVGQCEQVDGVECPGGQCDEDTWTCVCDTGYQPAPNADPVLECHNFCHDCSTGTCVDTCTASTEVCQWNGRDSAYECTCSEDCEGNDGNSECQATDEGFQCGCKDGYVLEGGSCKKDCDAGCLAADNEECIRDVDTAECVCTAGHVNYVVFGPIQSPLDYCVEDHCGSGTDDDCGANSNCLPTYDGNTGRYSENSCFCNTYYRLDGDDCVPDCSSLPSPPNPCLAAHNEICQIVDNLPSCDCLPGFARPPATAPNTDVCVPDNCPAECPSNSHCAFDADSNSFECLCNLFHSEAPDGSCQPDCGAECRDDENEVCVLTNSGSSCQCQSGYVRRVEWETFCSPGCPDDHNVCGTRKAECHAPLHPSLASEGGHHYCTCRRGGGTQRCWPEPLTSNKEDDNGFDGTTKEVVQAVKALLSGDWEDDEEDKGDSDDGSGSDCEGNGDNDLCNGQCRNCLKEECIDQGDGTGVCGCKGPRRMRRDLSDPNSRCDQVAKKCTKCKGGIFALIRVILWFVFGCVGVVGVAGGAYRTRRHMLKRKLEAAGVGPAAKASKIGAQAHLARKHTNVEPVAHMPNLARRDSRAIVMDTDLATPTDACRLPREDSNVSDASSASFAVAFFDHAPKDAVVSAPPPQVQAQEKPRLKRSASQTQQAPAAGKSAANAIPFI